MSLYLQAFMPRNNRALKSAWLKGARAAYLGFESDNCPYQDKRTAAGRVTFALAFRNYWQNGFEMAKIEIGHDQKRSGTHVY